MTDEPAKPTQQEKALATIRAIFDGADLGEETQRLSNGFTDEVTGRLAGVFLPKRDT